MKLLTQEIIKRFVEVGDQSKSTDPIVVAKFFNPAGQATWFATEYDADTATFFGYVSLFNQDGMNEWGYFTLAELEEIDCGFGLKIERDQYASEKTIGEWKQSMSIK
jgi:hypothetical protein